MHLIGLKTEAKRMARAQSGPRSGARTRKCTMRYREIVYILQESIPRLCVSHKCVKGCGDRRDINFACMGLQFASERFFEKVNTSCIHVVSGSLAKGFMMVHTHTHIHTHTHTPDHCMS